jgi:hypothetical protein
VAALLMITLANRWVYAAGSILVGAGVGLFIDEVGKFITRTNDYFYPPAAPIIYAFFLLLVLFYFAVRKRPSLDARSELYGAFDSLQEVLDRDLDAGEQAELEARLQDIINKTDQPALAKLSVDLLVFLKSDAVVVPHEPDPWERAVIWVEAASARLLTRGRLKAILIGGLIVLGAAALAGLVQLGLALAIPERSHELAGQLQTVFQRAGQPGLTWLVLRYALDAAAGLLLLLAAGLLAARRDGHAVRFAYLGLLLSLTVVDLMVFYLDQFSALLPALAQFLLLLSLLRYRHSYLDR